MHTLLSNMGRAFLKVFGAALLVAAIGMSQQPTLHGAVLVGIAGVMAALAAGLAAITTFLPQFKLSVLIHLPAPYGPMVDAGVLGFLGSFITAIIGLLAEPSLATWKAAIVGVFVGALTAGLRAVQGLLTPSEAPAVGGGITTP